LESKVKGAARQKRRLPNTAMALTLLASTSVPALDSTARVALSEAYYQFEVAGYCGLVNDAVAAGFHRRVGRLLADVIVDQEILDELRGKAWQAARGLGGFRGWCRNEGRAAAEGFLAEPP
jgi:hypothetical protein